MRHNVILIGGGLGIPPLLFAARTLRESAVKSGQEIKHSHDTMILDCVSENEKNAEHARIETGMNGADSGAYRIEKSSIIALLGYRDEAYYSAEMSRCCDCVFDITDKDGTVMDLLRRVIAEGNLRIDGASVLACGPLPMLKAVAFWAAKRGVTAQVSLEERMGCGYGACVGCAIDTVRGREKVCKNGPVFAADDIVW